MPPHLAKRKRTAADDDDNDTSTDSPPTKIRASENARTNQDEAELDSDSDDGYGPPAPKPVVRPSSIGPSLPKNTDGNSIDEEEQTISPSAPLPPTTNTAKRSIGPTLPSTNTDEIDLESEDDDVGPAPPEPKRVHGPAPPPANLSERPPAHSESDSDDDYGPALPSSTSHQERQARARALEAAEAEAAIAKGPQRDEWMLAPPTAGGYRAQDPTKIKARRFNSGPRTSANSGGGSGGEISSIWTETPEEKRKRLENAVLGRDTTATTSSNPRLQSHNSSSSSSNSKEDAARIQNYTESTRGRSLMEEIKAARERGEHPKTAGPKKGWADEEVDDPSKRAFDKEKDMKLGGRITASQRKEFLNKSADFGGRFAKGKYL